MIQIITTSRLRALEDETARLKQAAEDAAGERDAARRGEELANDAAIRADLAVETLSKQLDAAKEEIGVQFSGLHAVIRQVTAERDAARADAEEARREVEEARAQVLLDHEDRVALRALLRTVRQQQGQGPQEVSLLFKDGTYRGVYPTRDAAQAAAEKSGAHGGWTSYPARDSVPAPDTGWRVETTRVEQ